MYNYNQRNRLSSPTVLGIDERWERVLCYVFGWVSGLIFLVIESRNSTVRRHAWQSLVVFGTLNLLGVIIGLFGGLLSHIWLIGPLFGLGFGLISGLIGLVSFVLWILLMVLAFMSPETFVRGPRSTYV
ncbi:MAG TPA: hypothetical protein VF510_01825 [Ktedonobacterales bacterium]